ncbi:MAG TPA: universal stress protein [Solirubrobacterales bacterium]|nr:universal stress protein [Solirubrobacterales bacterium]
MGQIVVGYDGSDSSKAALGRAVELAKGLGDEVALVFGYSPPGIWGGEIAEHEEAIEEFGEKLMDEAKQQVRTDGVRVTYELVPKRGAEAVLDVARQRDARMVVVGSSGETPLKGAILGSTPYKLLHQSECPVLVVPTS